MTNASEDAWGYSNTASIAYGLLHPTYVFYAWGNLTAEAGYSLFSGSEKSIEHLTNLISDGKMMALESDSFHLVPETPTSSRARRDAITRAFWASALPAGWSATNAGVFVFDSGLTCDSQDGVPLSSDLADIPGTIMTQETANATGSCYNGKMYFLLSAKGTSQVFTVPKGLEKLDTDEYGKFSRHDIIQG